MRSIQHTKECYADVGDAALLQDSFYGDPKIDGSIVKCNGNMLSIYIYNDYNDVDKFVERVKECIEFFSQFEGENNE